MLWMCVSVKNLCDVYWVCASECFILYNWYDLQFEIWSRFYWGNVRCEVEGLLSWLFGFPAGGCHFGEFTGSPVGSDSQSELISLHIPSLSLSSGCEPSATGCGPGADIVLHNNQFNQSKQLISNV